MVYAKIFTTRSDGSSKIYETVDSEELGNLLNYVQNCIFEQTIVKAMVEAVDPTAKPIAEMFNNLASDLLTLQNTQRELYKASNKTLT